MELRVSLETPSTPSSDVLADIQAGIAAKKRATTRIEAGADGPALVVESGAVRVADVVNSVTAVVAARHPAPVVLIRGEQGPTVRIDSQVARTPFELLIAVTTLDPPVGLG